MGCQDRQLVLRVLHVCALHIRSNELVQERELSLRVYLHLDEIVLHANVVLKQHWDQVPKHSKPEHQVLQLFGPCHLRYAMDRSLGNGGAVLVLDRLHDVENKDRLGVESSPRILERTEPSQSPDAVRHYSASSKISGRLLWKHGRNTSEEVRQDLKPVRSEQLFSIQCAAHTREPAKFCGDFERGCSLVCKEAVIRIIDGDCFQDKWISRVLERCKYFRVAPEDDALRFQDQQDHPPPWTTVGAIW
mmetsp:Transcript_451/g.1279  ORF Transcript_451/g.1279 Transcript_451/m.1279 type:complete len:247 (-) Transcript_451:4351-5091(-)